MNHLNQILSATGTVNRWLGRQSWIPLAILIAAGGVVGTQNANAEDRLAGDLFSAITMSDTTAAASEKKNQTAQQRDEVLGVVSLAKVFSSAKIASEVDSQAVLVSLADLSTDVAETIKTAKLRLTVDAESHRVNVMLPLRTVTQNEPVDGAKLMRLLVRLSEVSDVQLIATKQTIALHTSLSNQSVTTEGIQAAVERLVAAANKTESIASMLGNMPTTAASESRQATKPAGSTTPVAATQPTSVLGTWSAKTSATDAWAIRFNADKKFVMVHTRSGKNSVSRGNYQLTANQLVLSETNGVTLKGQLIRKSEKSFAWKLQNDSGKTLTTLTFKQQ